MRRALPVPTWLADECRHDGIDGAIGVERRVCHQATQSQHSLELTATEET